MQTLSGGSFRKKVFAITPHLTHAREGPDDASAARHATSRPDAKESIICWTIIAGMSPDHRLTHALSPDRESLPQVGRYQYA